MVTLSAEMLDDGKYSIGGSIVEAAVEGLGGEKDVDMSFMAIQAACDGWDLVGVAFLK